jgi:hypothetical protein
MNNDFARTPAVQAKYLSRRAMLNQAILNLAVDPHVRSFALARALDGLELPELELLLDEIDETYYGRPQMPASPARPDRRRNS